MMYTMMIGLNDKETKKQEISTDVALNIVKSLCWEMFEGSTVSLAYGLYKHDDGEKVSENTIRVELMMVNESQVKQFVETIKKALNQESVLVIKAEIKSDLW